MYLPEQGGSIRQVRRRIMCDLELDLGQLRLDQSPRRRVGPFVLSGSEAASKMRSMWARMTRAVYGDRVQASRNESTTSANRMSAISLSPITGYTHLINGLRQRMSELRRFHAALWVAMYASARTRNVVALVFDLLWPPLLPKQLSLLLLPRVDWVDAPVALGCGCDCRYPSICQRHVPI